MIKTVILRMLMVTVAAAFASGCQSSGKGGRGEAIFMEKCAMCHPNGGNVVRGIKGLKLQDLQTNNINNAKDIVAYLRKPGPDMPAFDSESLPEKEAVELAEYILKTFR